MEYKRQEYIDKLISKKDNGRIKILSGIKGSGKSYLLFTLFNDYLLSIGIKEEQIIKIALDDSKNKEYRNPFILNNKIKEKISNNKKNYIFIDEIENTLEVQNPYVDNKDKISYIDVLLSLMKNPNVDIYVTTSNSKRCSCFNHTQFRDRGDFINIYPLSFKEVSESYNDLTLAWDKYKTFGGMPYVQSLESRVDKSLYLKKMVQETYIREIQNRYKIRIKKDVLNYLLLFISSSIGTLSNPLKLANRFKLLKNINIQNETVAKYIKLFEEVRLLYSIKRYDIKEKRFYETPVKYYFIDIGLRNALIDFTIDEDSFILENIIFNELIKRGFNVDTGVINDRHYVDKKLVRETYQVDFIINKGNFKCYIQTSFSPNNEENIEEKRNPLLKIKDSFKKIIIVKNSIIPHYDEYGIFYIGLFDFLLKDDFLK